MWHSFLQLTQGHMAYSIPNHFILQFLSKMRFRIGRQLQSLRFDWPPKNLNQMFTGRIKHAQTVLLQKNQNMFLLASPRACGIFNTALSLLHQKYNICCILQNGALSRRNCSTHLHLDSPVSAMCWSTILLKLQMLQRLRTCQPTNTGNHEIEVFKAATNHDKVF